MELNIGTSSLHHGCTPDFQSKVRCNRFEAPNREGKTKAASTSWPKQIIAYAYVYVSMLRWSGVHRKVYL